MHRRHGCNDQHAEFNAMCVVVAVEQCRYILPVNLCWCLRAPGNEDSRIREKFCNKSTDSLPTSHTRLRVQGRTITTELLHFKDSSM